MAYDTVNHLLDDGVWTPPLNGCQYLVAHLSCDRFQRELARRQQPHRRKIEAGQMDPTLNRQILCDAMAHGLLLDWRNVRGSDGQIHEYSPERGAMALRNDPELRDFVTEFSSNIQNYRSEEVQNLGNV